MSDKSGRRRTTAWLVLSIAAAIACGCRALPTSGPTDWPTYRYDISRSGVTRDEVRPPLAPCWVFRPLHPPQPAWSDPKPIPVEGILEGRRVHFDDVFHVAVAGGAVFFGSSANGKVYSLDAETGDIRWTAMTGGPVRLAPTVSNGRVFVGSDDGFVYCFNASDGSKVWKFKAALGDRKVLGHGRMISLWPVRTGVLVDGGVAYFGAGIFPAEGVFLCAVRAEDGQLLWRNDSCAEDPRSNLSPQGYLLASDQRLYAPMGRASPALFDRANGKLLHQLLLGKRIGGTYAVLDGDRIFTGTVELVGYDAAGPQRQSAWFEGRKILVTSGTLYSAADGELIAVKRAAYGPASIEYINAKRAKEQADVDLISEQRRGKNAARIRELTARSEAQAKRLETATARFNSTVLWRAPLGHAEEMILSGGIIFAGGQDEVVAFDADDGRKLWSAPVAGAARGLAVASGRLFVSTDSGAIYCFGPADARETGTIAEPADASPYPKDDLTPVYESAAETILRASGVKKGYCLVLGCETGRLAFELAKRSELMIYAVEPDPAKAEAARKALDAAGLYGSRISIETAPLSNAPYPDYFANLIVSETALLSGEFPDMTELLRMLKPAGGVAIHGRNGRPPAKEPGTGTGLKWQETPANNTGMWYKAVRGPLEGAGTWTHQYAEPGNTACSDDLIVKAPFDVLWFGEPGPNRMVSRHARAAAPLSVGGRFFVQGEDVIMAYDAYNGLELWRVWLRQPPDRRRPIIPRVAVPNETGNFVADENSIFVAFDDKCRRFDAATGEVLKTYVLPTASDGEPRRWGYLARVGRLLYGSSGDRRGGASDRLFALDVSTGEEKWSYAGKAIRHAAVCISGGRLFLADADATDAERDDVLRDKIAALTTLEGAERTRAEEALKKADVRRVVALDAATGAPIWKRLLDLTDCGGDRGLSALCAEDTLLLFGVYVDGHYWLQFFAGTFDSRRILALSADDGRTLWDRKFPYRVRPLVVGNTLHAEPWAFDLRTAEPKLRPHPLTGEPAPWQFARPGHHCGCPAASPNALFFRSGCIGYYDLTRDNGTMHFGAQRPGCWINFIPANGLVMLPESSSGCMCDYPNMFTIVFQPGSKERNWSVFSAPGPTTPVRQLAVNLGAPGDKKDDSGCLWLGHPRPYDGRLVLDPGVDCELLRGGNFFRHNPTLVRIDGTHKPWVFASGVRGLRRLAVPLVGRHDPPGVYTVRLAFAEPDESASPGRRVFDVRVQGRLVLKDFDIVAEAGGPNRAVVREFSGVGVLDSLVLEFTPQQAKPGPGAMPLLNGFEVVRTEVFPVRMAPPAFTLSEQRPRQTKELRVTSFSARPVSTEVAVSAPPGMTVRPSTISVNIEPGETKLVPIEVEASDAAKAGEYAVRLALGPQGGLPEYVVHAPVTHVAGQRTLAVKASEDAYVRGFEPAENFGAERKLSVDGGLDAMGDPGHSIAYLRFPLDVPGRSVSATLRLHVAPNPASDSADAVRVRLVEGAWEESTVTYRHRPVLRDIVGKIERVKPGETVEVPLDVPLAGRKELSLALDPAGLDNAVFRSRESGHPAELIVRFEPESEEETP